MFTQFCGAFGVFGLLGFMCVGFFGGLMTMSRTKFGRAECEVYCFRFRLSGRE